mmetsp:Transcript_10677/g.20136  ORF Transcript_10677/g.20136 Transcript_10677/m.20136 type:complete len:239 (-) Transcript_10677:206-922(-)
MPVRVSVCFLGLESLQRIQLHPQHLLPGGKVVLNVGVVVSLAPLDDLIRAQGLQLLIYQLPARTKVLVLLISKGKHAVSQVFQGLAAVRITLLHEFLQPLGEAQGRVGRLSIAIRRNAEDGQVLLHQLRLMIVSLDVKRSCGDAALPILFRYLLAELVGETLRCARLRSKEDRDDSLRRFSIAVCRAVCSPSLVTIVASVLGVRRVLEPQGERARHEKSGGDVQRHCPLSCRRVALYY